MPVTITLQLPARVQERVQTEAARRSIPVEQYLTDLVSRAVPAAGEEDRARLLTLLARVENLGDDAEQEETFAYLHDELNRNRLSERDRLV